MPPLVLPQMSRAPGDCAVCALSMFLQRPYEDVLAAAVQSTDSGRIHINGMTTRDMKRTAQRLGVSLKLRRGFDFDEDDGVLSVCDKREQHAVLLRAGLIFDSDGSCWEPAEYLDEFGYRAMSLLVRVE